MIDYDECAATVLNQNAAAEGITKEGNCEKASAGVLDSTASTVRADT